MGAPNQPCHVPYAVCVVQPSALIAKDGVAALCNVGAEAATHQLLLLNLGLLRGMHVLMLMYSCDALL